LGSGTYKHLQPCRAGWQIDQAMSRSLLSILPRIPRLTTAVQRHRHFGESHCRGRAQWHLRSTSCSVCESAKPRGAYCSSETVDISCLPLSFPVYALSHSSDCSPIVGSSRGLG
jgi:predicted ArsR family transcriptional regulator